MEQLQFVLEVCIILKQQYSLIVLIIIYGVLVLQMKWLGGGDGDAALRIDNMDRGPQRTQDDAAVGYVFQRPPDPEFPSFGPKQARWALGDDSIIDVSI